jgi:hypothetical protein
VKARHKIENWRIEPTGSGSFWVRGLSTKDDIRFHPGTLIHTSRLINVNFEKMEAETLNSIYELGSPE